MCGIWDFPPLSIRMHNLTQKYVGGYQSTDSRQWEILNILGEKNVYTNRHKQKAGQSGKEREQADTFSSLPISTPTTCVFRDVKTPVLILNPKLFVGVK